MSFNLGNTEESTGKSGLYIYPGVLNVQILGWSKGDSTAGSPYISVTLITELAAEEKPDASKEFKFYMTDAAKSTSMKKIKHIMTKVATNDQINKDVENLDQFISLLNNLSSGKTLRIKFSGKEYEYEGKVKTTAEIGLPTFAEANKNGAEYPAVADADTKLVYDEKNEYDLKRLDIDPDAEPTTGEAEKAKADTSFLDNM